MENINRVLLTGNLTRDPELKEFGDTTLVNMRLAVNVRVKREGEWQDKACYFDVTAFGAQAKNCAQYLSKGKPVAVDGRLDWREWQDKEDNKRQGVSIIADTVQFLPSRHDGDSGDPGVDIGAAEPAAVGGAPDDEDIPF